MKLRILLLLFVIANAFAQTGTVKGRVLDAIVRPFQKEPIVGASVTLPGTQTGASSDMEGKFMIKGLPLGMCTLRASALGYDSETIRVNVEPDSVGNQEIEILLWQACVLYGMPQVYQDPKVPDSLRETTRSKLKPPQLGKCALSGHVVDKESGKPIPAAHISAGFEFNDETGQRRVGCCLGGPVDSLGHFTLNNKFPGRYNLSACAEGYGRSVRLIETKADSVYMVDFELVKKTPTK